ncbi:MAG: NADH-quinone oxidoreductase subunit J [Candidatus Aminicenantes bacterium]|nr:cation:proton antiporter subunit C [Candidatus Aminicenantes bacterium]OQX53302.1 MAG: NADH-quinone oxidoreductase subunit J [Candidatus Aminicenantes bacterium 4484_214]RLE01662.1 MAG: NADH-quinone oxidoreductase subunit J [Candidatus Aminicenantes bacterium]RLE03971.1 MAG: NADH-quinone oxidoreductase subunit J [Candidatus Aminicenantes bacterium]HHF43575.1 NADH-quinone oxidoreductase subunit J [Candidatus Aminicenantes bacterium]
MIKFLLGHYAYWFILALLVIGLYGLIIKRNLVKKVIGLSIFQVAIILFFIASSTKWGATVPVLTDHQEVIQSAAYINPLPHTLMLTAIVVGVATSGVAFALIILIYRRYRTLNENELLERLKEDEPE